ncbi:hypothetical protein DM01DRAFT_263294 [Hesseltinella vesiculosa]|uniref:Uncharacterized protein n=1 Tax=Hesseltinella vesiculosa TaxID=101127 RepID=A0A1X2GF18_9FUNG|nr:hypothetical protein DM01DRAFT_263294 [Hesseltinella vesiculosa]
MHWQTLCPSFPFVALNEDMNETEHCTRFVEPYLAGLLDDPSNGTHLRWTDERTLAAKADRSSQRRPDLTKCCGVNWSNSLAYGEAKPAVLQSLPALVTKAPQILNALDVFDRLCVLAASPNDISE